MAINIGSLTAAQQIQLIYTAYFGRAAEPDGFNFWTPLLQENLNGDADGVPGFSFTQIADLFFNQAETRKVYDLESGVTSTTDLPSTADFLFDVYQNLFGRVPEPAGVLFWGNVLDSGEFTIGEVILKIVEGASAADEQALLNRIEAGLDWKDAAEAFGVDEVDAVNPDPNYDSAVDALDDVTNDPQTLADAKAATDAFFNEAPTAANESDSTLEDNALNGDVSDKTDDADGDTLTHSVEPGDGPANGTVTMNADGTYTYTPNADFNGTDSFTYTVDDGKGGTDTGTVFLTVTAVNDDPVAQTGIVSTTAEDTAVNGSVSSSDVDGGAPSYSVFTGPTDGTVTMNPDGTYTYTPDDDFNGTDSFVYQVSDGNGGTDTATVNITINPVDDAPVAQDESNVATEDGGTVNGQLDADDIDNANANITFALNAAAPAGLTVNTDGSYSFDPSVPAYQSLAAGETLVVAAGYTATSNGKTDTGTITITVTGTNDTPVAQALSVAGVEDTVATGLVEATDVDNNETLVYSVAPGDGPTNGDVTMNPNGSFEYVPDANFNGTDTFTYTVTDSAGATSTAVVTVNVVAETDELTVDPDNFQGSVADDIITGNENTLNAGDSIEGGDGDDTLIINVNTGASSNLNFAGFVANVETFQTTIDGGGSATFDMSGSEITGNTFVNANSTADVTYDRVNMNPDGPDADSRPQLDVELRNVTQGASTTFTTRPAEVVGPNDEANVLMTNLDDNAHIGELSFFGTPGDSEASAAGTANSGLEVFDLSVEGSPLDVFLNDLNTPGGNTLNIATDTGPGAAALTIGDETIPGDVAASTSTNFMTGAATGSVSGFENAVSNDITTVTSSGDGDVALSLQDDGDTATAARSSGVTGTFDAGDDIILGSQLNDNLSGGEGNDTLNGAGGNDSLLGQDGNDLLIGDDDSIGGIGNDTLRGGEGQDTLLGGGGDDDLFGDAGNDQLFGADGNDSLVGGAGNDSISTGDSTDASNETVEGGEGSDTVFTRGEQLQGRSANDTDPLNILDQLSGGTDGAGPDAAGNDVLNIVGSSADTRGLNDVTEFEQINLSGGTFTYTIGNSGSTTDTTAFETDHDNGNSGPTIISGKEAGSVNIDASTLDNGIGLAGGDSNDTLIGGRGDDTLAGDADSLGSNGGSDNLVGNAGNDTFIFDGYELTTNDTVSGGLNTDTILIEERSINATLGSNVSSVENLVLADAYSDFSVQLEGQSGDLFGSMTVTLDSTFNNVFQNNTLNIDATALDQPGEVFTLNSDEANDADLNVTGGSNGDTFNMGDNLTVLDTIDGADGEDTLTINSNAGGDADFTNVSNVETLKLDATFSGTLTLGAEASEAGFNVIDASMVVGNITIDASDFGRAVTIIDGDGNSTIIGPDDDPLTLQMGGGNDTITTGTADDVIQIDDNDLNFGDVITDNGGDDTVEFQNMAPINEGGITAGVDLDNVTGIENYTFAGDGNIPNDNLVDSDLDGLFADDDDVDAHSLLFQGGNVGTVTDIRIDGSNVTDTRDSLEVVIGGTDNLLNNVDVDYRFTIDGTAGNDRLYKANNGLNNQIVFNGGAGSDTVSIFDGDLGGSTTIDGGTGIDWLSQTGGVWNDDDFINVSNVEGLTAESPLVATLGANAAAAGIDRILGTTLNEDVTLDAAFTNDLLVDIRQGGDDTIDGGASSSTLTFFGRSSSNDITAADALTGGTGTNDSILVDNNGNGTVDLSNTNGVEVVNITETASGNLTLVLGNTNNDNANNLLTINENSTPNSFFGEGGNPWDGETFVVDGANYNGAILLNGQVGGGGAVGDITTSNTGNFDDTINAADGNDTISTNGGNDVIDAGNGNDVVDGGAGNDSIDGGFGFDSLLGNTGNDTINGGANDDTIDGGTGIDVLDGGDGNDLIIGGGNEETPNPAVNQGDRLTGGNGNDTFRFFQVSDSAGLDHDTITDWANGNNTIDLDENLLFQAGGAATSVGFAGNAPNFAQAQGTIAATAGDGVADYVFQAGNAVEAPTLWIDVNDDGVLNAQDLQIELEGFTGTFSGGEVTLSDNATPDAPTILSIDTPAGSDDTGAENDDFITSDQTVTVRVGFSTATDGTGARAGDTVTLNHPGILGGTTTLALAAADITNGYVDFVIPGPLADGTTSALSAFVTDTFITSEDSATSATETLVIDTSVAAPTITSADDDTVGENGTNVDGITNDTTQTLTGTAEAGAEVEVFDGVVSLGTATADGSGNWTFTTAALADGVHSFTAVQTDLAGNVSAPSAATAVTVDTLASVTITGLGSEPTTDDDIIAGSEDTAGGWTVTGTVTNVENGQTVTVEVLDDADNVVHTFAGVAVAAGAFTTGAAPANLFSADGTYTARATVEDVAGNEVTNDFDFLVDETGPSISVTSAVYDSENGTLTLNGTFDAAELIANVGTFTNTLVQVDGNALGATTIVTPATDITGSQIVLTLNADNGALGADGFFPNGSNDLVDVQAGAFTDALGNASTADTGNAIQFDLRTSDFGAPATLVGQGLDDTFEFDDSGRSATGNGGADTFLVTDDGTNDFSVAIPGVVADINDFDSSAGDLIQFQAGDLNAILAGTPFANGDDGSKVFFQTFESGTVTTESGVGGTFIYNAADEELRFDVDGQTSFNGSAVDPTGSDDDIIIDLTGISLSGVTASDIEII